MARSTVYVVSGLPRSGTSLMLQMLRAGGLSVLTDGVRSADEDNPRGYLELEPVKRTAEDPAWLDQAEGHAVKVISHFLPNLPVDRTYKIVFMRRDLDEVLRSQKKMLERRGESNSTSDEDMKELFIRHLEDVEKWLASAPHARSIFVNYGKLLAEPHATVERIRAFLGMELDGGAMLSVIDPTLFRSGAR